MGALKQLQKFVCPHDQQSMCTGKEEVSARQAAGTAS